MIGFYFELTLFSSVSFHLSSICLSLLTKVKIGDKVTIKLLNLINIIVGDGEGYALE